MPPYKRNIDIKLTLLKLLSLVILVLSVYLISVSSVYSYLILILAIPFSFINIKNITIEDNYIQLEKIYGFGWIRVKRELRKEDFQSRVKLYSSIENNESNMGSGELIDLVGCLFIFAQSKTYQLSLKYQKKNAEWDWDTIYLNQIEYGLIKSILN